MPPSTGPSPADVIAALQRGGVIEALKLVLAAKSRGLTSERNASAHAGSPPRPHSYAPLSRKASHLSPGEVPRSSNDIWLLLVLIAALCIYYFFGH